MKKLKVDPKVLADVVEIMSRDGRRAVVKIDDRKVDHPADVTASELHAASEVDVSSFWVNPDRPTFGRRHFVYFLAGPSGTQYFGDSISPEVRTVCEALDAYFGNTFTPTPSNAQRPTMPKWWPSGWLFETPERTVSALGLLGVLIAVLAFMAGRWSATPDYTQPFVVSPPPASTPNEASSPVTDPPAAQP